MDEEQLIRALLNAQRLKAAGQADKIPSGTIREMLADRERERLEGSLHEFSKAAWPILEPVTHYIDGRHIRILCELLQRVTTREIDRTLLVNVPPGTMKSLACSVFWPCWAWARQPDTRWLFASYSAERSTYDSRRRRQLLQSEWYKERWGDSWQFVGDQNRQTRYENSANGWMYSTSVGGAATGEHPDYVVADDPHKVKEAESDEEREHAIRWWRGTIGSRGVVRGVRRVVIMQRLHESDLSGNLIDGGDIEHVCFPMRYERDHPYPCKHDWRVEDGQLLWSEAFDEIKVRAMERDMGSYTAAGQLQQRPSPRGGALFKADWIQLVDEVPRDYDVAVRYWDCAASKAKAADYTAGARLLVDKAGIVWLDDMVCGKWSPGERDNVVLATAGIDGPNTYVFMELESGASGPSLIAHYTRLLAGYVFRGDRVSQRGRKERRAEPLASYMQAGNVRIRKAEWTRDVVQELLSFPFGNHDDRTDSFSGAYNCAMDLQQKTWRSREPLICSGEDPVEERRPFTQEELAELPEDWRELVEEMRASGREATRYDADERGWKQRNV